MSLKEFLDLPPWEWPPRSDEEFTKVLLDKHADLEDREIAAELAGDFTVINDELAGLLIGIACNSDEPEQLRARAAISLGAALESADWEDFDVDDECPITEPVFHGLQNKLRELYADERTPALVRRRVLEAAVRAPADWQKKAIRTAYASGDAQWMVTAVFAMGYIRGFDKQLLESLKNTDLDIQVEAVKAAGRREVDAAWEQIAEFIQDKKSPRPLLSAAIGAIGQIRQVESSDILIDLTESKDEEIAEAAEEALTEAGYTAHDFNEDDFEEDEGEWVN